MANSTGRSEKVSWVLSSTANSRAPPASLHQQDTDISRRTVDVMLQCHVVRHHPAVLPCTASQHAASSPAAEANTRHEINCLQLKAVIVCANERIPDNTGPASKANLRSAVRLATNASAKGTYVLHFQQRQQKHDHQSSTLCLLMTLLSVSKLAARCIYLPENTQRYTGVHRGNSSV